ncbi:hypothetical protein BH10ACI2_BH10ACI2_09520 [soil metagenome]
MQAIPRHFFEFDAFRVDVDERRLFRNGEAVAVAAKDFEILLTLIENSGHTVRKDELMETVWKDTFVEEGNLNRHISTLRKLLSDDTHEQRFIKTIPKLGYRFTGDVKEITVANELTESVSRTHLVIREEMREGFWTVQRAAFATAMLIGSLFLGAWAFSTAGIAKGQKRSGISANADSAHAFNKGRELWRTRNAENLHEATVLLETSVEKDPDFALAHAALADAYAFDYTNWKNADAQANLAIALDPELGEPHASRGFIKMFWQWDLLAAESELKQAVIKSPDYATGHQWYAATLAAMGRFDAAQAEIKRAIELEPTSAAIRADLCQILYFGGRNMEALTECGKTLALDPANLSANQHLYDIYSTLGMNDESVDKFIENRRLIGNIRLPAESDLRQAYAFRGIDGFRRAQIDFFLQNQPEYFNAAKTYARLGQIDKAFAALSIASERKEWDFIYVADPVFMQMRQDPRMLELTSTLYRQANQ